MYSGQSSYSRSLESEPFQPPSGGATSSPNTAYIEAIGGTSQELSAGPRGDMVLPRPVDAPLYGGDVSADRMWLGLNPDSSWHTPSTGFGVPEDGNPDLY